MCARLCVCTLLGVLNFMIFLMLLFVSLSLSPPSLSPPPLSLSPASRVGKGYMYTLNYMYYDPLQYTIMALSFSPIPTWILLQLS